jgi:hypothetical protein
VLPGAVHLERAVADRGLLEPIGVLGVGRGQGIEGGVAQGQGELAERTVEGDLEGGVVDHLQAAHRLGLGLLALVGLKVLVTPDVLEEVGVAVGVGPVGAGVPGVDERLGGHRLAVVEGPAALELDRPDLLVVGGDRLPHRPLEGLGGGLRVVLHQRGEQGVEHLGAAGLVGVLRDQVLGLADVDREAAALGTGGGAGLAVVRPAGGRHQAHREQQGRQSSSS